MTKYTESVEKLLERLIRLPGIGRRSAERMVNYLLSAEKSEVRDLIEAIAKVKDNVRLCAVCNNLSEQELCAVCHDSGRRQDLVCVVQQPKDVTAVEKTGYYKGLYHVLMGAIAPLEGRGPADLKIDGLLSRIKGNGIKEIIIATDADTDGETTALYLTKLIRPLGVRVSRIGLGLPVGSQLEYADSATLLKALESRRDI